LFTEREYLGVEDLIHYEELAAKKAHQYAQLTRDPEIQGIMSSIAQRHADHLDALLQHVRQGQQQSQPPVTYQQPPIAGRW